MRLSSSTAQIMAATVVAVCALSISALSQITVTYPANNSTVPMPVWLRVHAGSCAGDTNMTGIGYSFDNSPFITWGQTNYDVDSIDYRPSSPGTYAVHFKAWSKSGACTPVDNTVTVTGPNTSSNANADADGDWIWVYDTGTGGSATGSTAYPVTTQSQDQHSRQFKLNFTNNGGMRGSTAYGNDVNANHFIYDTYVWLDNPASVLNLEMDMNQVYTATNVVIIGLQCATVGTSHVWEYTTVAYVNGKWQSKWNQTSVDCSRLWQGATWHHVQLIEHTDGKGTAYYDSVILDGKKSDLNVSGAAFFQPAQPWTPLGKLVLNFQIDGNGSSGSVTAYTDGLTMLWWQQ